MKKPDLVKEAIARFKESSDAYDGLREQMVDDLHFLDGDQWPADLVSSRQADGRPCLVINKGPSFVDQVEGDQRQNRPSVKVIPVNSDSDPDTAEVLTGQIRNIKNISAANVAQDTAFNGAVSCGMGAWRILTEYEDDNSFDQEIVIRRIKNQFTVYPDPNAQEWSCEDGEYMFVTEKLARDAYRRKWPRADPCEWDSSRDDKMGWIEPDTIRVAEYFYKERAKKTLHQIQYDDGRVDILDELPPQEEDFTYTVIQDREVETEKIMWGRLNGKAILEGPTEWPGKYYPIIILWGKELCIEGKTIYRGVIRNYKDSQRLYNYSRSMGAETVALAPKAPYVMTAKQVGIHQAMWDTAHKKNHPYLLYDPDPQAKGPPIRTIPNIANTGIQAETVIADQEMHDTTGLQQASLGKRSNEKSGVAIRERKNEGDVGQFAYHDNLGRALKYEGKVLVDLIPKIYDTARTVRVQNEDDSTDFVDVNQEFTDKKTGKTKKHDLSAGKYDVTPSIGPSYQTQREEAQDSMLGFMQAFPNAAPLIGDLAAKNMDWPGADEIAKRLKKILPAGIAEPEEGEEDVPTEPPPPDPMQEIQMQQEQAKLEGILLDNLKTKAETEKIEAEEAQTRKETNAPETDQA